MKLPDPLDRHYPHSYDRKDAPRMLTDRGIRQALETGIIKIDPPLDTTDSKRIQPATLDVKFLKVDDYESIGNSEIRKHTENNTIQSGTAATVELTEMINFESINYDSSSQILLQPSVETRSTIRILGLYAMIHGSPFINGPEHRHIEIGNLGPNDIRLEEDRIAQIFFRLDPFLDYLITSCYGGEGKPLEEGEKLRALDMGVECIRDEDLENLEKSGYMKISPKLRYKEGKLLVHADNTAYRMKTIPEGIIFSQREIEEFFEPVDISNGYTIKPFENIIVPTQESFELSPHVGIRFVDNVVDGIDVRSLYDASNEKEYMRRITEFRKNSELLCLTSGWIDPGYKGGFSRQPKTLTERTIHPGDVIGFGKVVYFPNGVERPYGSGELGSQYQF